MFRKSAFPVIIRTLVVFLTNRCHNSSVSPLPLPVCENETVALIETNTYCGYILDTNGPFSECAELPLAVSHIQDCIMDVCSVTPDEDLMKRVACGSLVAFAVRCWKQSAPPAADWKITADCGEVILIPRTM